MGSKRYQGVGLIPKVAVVLTLAVLVVACGGGSSSTTTTTGPTVPAWTDRAGTWSFFVYVDADTNLEAEALDDLRQMAQTSTTQIIALVDRAAGYSSGDVFGLGNFTDSALLSISNGKVTLLDTPGELNMGAPDTLSSFLTYGLKNHKGQKNALVIWDHGGSWKGAAWDDSATDPQNPGQKDGLTLAEISSGTRKGLTDAGVTRLDMIAFDACLMATYEVALAVESYADVMVASEETEPGHGWNWTSVGTGASGSTTKAMSDAILQGYRVEAEEGGNNDVTMSSIDLHSLGTLTAAIDGLADALRKSDVRVGRVGYGRDQAISFGKNPNPKQDYFSVDLGAFASEIAQVDGMGGAAAALGSAVHEVVIRRISGSVSETSTGVAAYFPPVEDHFSPNYATLSLAPSWLRVLRAYYAAANRVPDSKLPYFIDTDGVLEASNVISDNDSVELLAKVASGTGGNIIAGYINFGLLEADNDLIEVLGDINASVAGDTVSGVYGWRYLMISDGVTSTPAYASINVDSTKTVNLITVPVILTDGTDEVEGSLVLNMNDDQILGSTFYYQSSSGAMSAIQPREGLWFVPLYQSYRLSTDASEWLPASDTLLATASSSLAFNFERLPVGQSVFAGLSIVDVKGGGDAVIHRTTAPPE